MHRRRHGRRSHDRHHPDFVGHAPPQRNARTAHLHHRAPRPGAVHHAQRHATADTEHDHALHHGAPAIEIDHLGALPIGKLCEGNHYGVGVHDLT